MFPFLIHVFRQSQNHSQRRTPCTTPEKIWRKRTHVHSGALLGAASLPDCCHHNGAYYTYQKNFSLLHLGSQPCQHTCIVLLNIQGRNAEIYLIFFGIRQKIVFKPSSNYHKPSISNQTSTDKITTFMKRSLTPCKNQNKNNNVPKSCLISTNYDIITIKSLDTLNIKAQLLQL